MDTTSNDESKLKVSINENRQAVFETQENQFGTVNITYTAKDEGGLENTITQQITIDAVNDNPILNPISNVSFNEDETYVGSAITGSDVEDVLSEMVLSASSNNPDIQVSIDENKIPTYTATANYNGSGTINFTLTDTNGGTDNQNVNVTVNSINDAVQSTGSIADKVVDKGNNVVILKSASK